LTGGKMKVRDIFQNSKWETMTRWHVSRLDRIEAYLNAIIELHPELANSQHVKDFEERRRSAQKELTP